jgi:hypothetical protein
MKKLFLVLCSFALISVAEGKKVKFTVNMVGQAISPNGVHVSGDFQEAAGFPGVNWDCDKMLMTQEAGDTNLYSLIVDIPAFQKYEYKFINGDLCYEVEVVPELNRAEYNFSDSRWIYVDSLSNDTTETGAILFGGTAPQGLTAVRFRVNMSQEAGIAPAGVHLAADFQGWDPQKNILYSFAGGIYEWIAFLNTGSYQFRYYNGNSAPNGENVPAACAVGANRPLILTADTIMDLICYASCNICWPTALTESEEARQSVFPNPANESLIVQTRGFQTLTVQSLQGNILLKAEGKDRITVPVSSLSPGIYLLHCNGKAQRFSVMR